MSDDIQITADGPIIRVTFNRPQARNAMTWEMYEGLAEACESANANSDVRLLSLRGAGGKAFVAGTDIQQFVGFTGDDGEQYEKRIEAVLSLMNSVNVPILATIEGHCVGGGLAIASCADIRVGAPNSSFAVPIARTLGNTLSAFTLKKLVAAFGEVRVRRMLLTAQPIRAEEALQIGFLSEVSGDLDDVTSSYEQRLVSGAPLTQWSIKEILRRLDQSQPVEDSDIINKVYGSNDFASAVRGFIDKREVSWTGH